MERCQQIIHDIDLALGEQALANLKMKIENFDPTDIDSGIWAYRAVAKIVYAEEDTATSDYS